MYIGRVRVYDDYCQFDGQFDGRLPLPALLAPRSKAAGTSDQ